MTRQRPISYTEVPHTVRGTTWPCARVRVWFRASCILHRINVTARGKGSGDAWGVSVRDQLGGSPEATRLDLLSREEKREN